MKRTLAVVFAVAIASSWAEAQDASTEQPATHGIMAGGEGVTGAYRGTLSSGAAFGLLAQFPLPSPRLSIRSDAMLNWLSGATSCSQDICASSSPSAVISLGVSMVARLNDPAARWSPYAFGGLAGYIIVQEGELTGFRTSPVGFQGGVGFEVRPRTYTYFVETRYMGIPPGGFFPVMIGMRRNF
jgi:hypothetical protein